MAGVVFNLVVGIIIGFVIGLEFAKRKMQKRIAEWKKEGRFIEKKAEPKAK